MYKLWNLIGGARSTMAANARLGSNFDQHYVWRLIAQQWFSQPLPEGNSTGHKNVSLPQCGNPRQITESSHKTGGQGDGRLSLKSPSSDSHAVNFPFHLQANEIISMHRKKFERQFHFDGRDISKRAAAKLNLLDRVTWSIRRLPLPSKVQKLNSWRRTTRRDGSASLSPSR